MKRAAMSNHRVKGEEITIDDDEQVSEQPVVKNVKVEVQPPPGLGEPASSEQPVESSAKGELFCSAKGELEAEVAELKQQLRKKEDMFQ
ncbi:hypothetical protein PMAYCL1PPCAC_26496, partial [Pristionchus mayeri]